MAEQNDDGRAIFVYNDGEPGVIRSSSGLHVGQHVVVFRNNVEVDLEKIIRFGDDGYIKFIDLISNNGEESESPENTYDYRIHALGAGPSSGSGYIHFTDSDTSPDTYDLKFYAHKEHLDYVRYNSGNPVISTITWDPAGSIKA